MGCNQKFVNRVVFIVFAASHGILPGYFSNNLNQSKLPDRGCVHMSLYKKNNQCIHLANCSVYEKCQTLCSVIFLEKNGVVEPEFAGCGDFCNAETQCPVQNYNDNNRFLCCCNGHLCNRNMVFNHSLVQLPALISTTAKGSSQQKSYLFTTYIFMILFGIFAVFVAIIYLWKKHKRRLDVQQPLLMQFSSSPPLVSKLDELIKLQEIVARGQFGNVWKALYANEYVAVKIIPEFDLNSWENELKVYTCSQMQNENILKFYAAEKLYENNCSHFWIVTEFHKNGSLTDFLRGNVIDLQHLERFVVSVTNGLKFLHSKVGSKPLIAHRDFKSKNILVKDNLTCCIGDFGSSVVFDDTYCNNKYAKIQVGTKRYMAPEVLEGAISSQPESLLFIDLYAFGLVLWEILTRCSVNQEPVNDYMAPYYNIVGAKPTLEVMLDCVSVKKLRPTFKCEWLKHPIISEVCKTISECWDSDAEARLSAHCVSIRFKTLFEQQVTLMNSPQEIQSHGLSLQHNTVPKLLTDTELYYSIDIHLKA